VTQQSEKSEPKLGDFLAAHSEVECKEINLDASHSYQQPSFSSAPILSFSGRLSVSRFWLLTLVFSFWIPVGVIFLFGVFNEHFIANQNLLIVLLVSYSLVMSIGLYFRRFKDLGLSLYWLLLWLLPFVNGIAGLYLMIKPGNKAENQFGLPNKPLPSVVTALVVVSWFLTLSCLVYFAESISIFFGKLFGAL
jgi:uncharacterized membrane protein YhaH (DUF805 family)